MSLLHYKKPKHTAGERNILRLSATTNSQTEDEASDTTSTEMANWKYLPLIKTEEDLTRPRCGEGKEPTFYWW